MRQCRNSIFFLTKLLLVSLLITVSGCSTVDVNFLSENSTAMVGDKLNLDFDISKGKEEDVSIRFDDDSLIKMNENGEYVAEKEGVIHATILYKDKEYDTKEIIVEPVLCEQIKADNISSGFGREVEVNPNFYPDTCTHKDFELSSSDEDVANVFGNHIIGKGEGTALITISSADGPSTQIQVEVFEIKPDKISIENLKNTYTVGDSATPLISFEPADVTNKEVELYSSDVSVLSIDGDGNIVANKKGKATITANYSDEISASKEIEVLYPPVSSVEVTANYSSIYVDDRMGMRTYITPELVDDDTIRWSSSDKDIAVVSSDGVVTALKEGTVTITATSVNGKKGTYKIQISKRPQVATSVPARSSSGSGSSYVLNTNTNKFHYPYCGSVNQMKESNKLFSDEDRDTIISWGYVPCKKCNP